MKLKDIEALEKGAEHCYWVGEYLQQPTQEWIDRSPLFFDTLGKSFEVLLGQDTQGVDTHHVRGADEWTANARGLIVLWQKRLDTFTLGKNENKEQVSVFAYMLRRV